MRLEVSLPSFKLGPFPILELPPNTIMGGDVWNRMGGFKSCFCHPLPLVPRLVLLSLLVSACCSILIDSLKPCLFHSIE